MQYFLMSLLFTSSACTVRKIPKDFDFGATSSAYQSEGAWNEDGKGPSIWDTALHQIRAYDGSTGDVAADMYHLYKQDVKLMSYLGLDSFRFSFSWSRILPTGFSNNINRAGIDYYNSFIDELIKHNITPCATIYHWDLPQKLQELGGWTNPHIIQWFEDYTKVLFDHFGGKVKMWTTINEPLVICSYGYGRRIIAPFVASPGIGEYICIKNSLLAHARAYHLYHTNYNEDGKGKVGISINPSTGIPILSRNGQEIVSDIFEFSFGIIANPIFYGDFPEVVKSRVRAKSAEQGYPRSRLPKLTQRQIEYINGTADFLGINSYFTYYVFKNALSEIIHRGVSLKDDLGVSFLFFKKSIDPKYFYRLLIKIKELYNNPTVYITENGWYNSGGLEDDDRIQYLTGHINAVLQAVDCGCDIRGYSVWTLLDNIEWIVGSKRKYGLYEVDFSSPNLTRTPRKSAFFYKNIIESRSIDLYNITDT